MIWRIDFNWFYSTDVGEEYCSYTVGEKGVKHIIELYFPTSKFDHFCYEVMFEDGQSERIFNINRIYYK